MNDQSEVSEMLDTLSSIIDNGGDLDEYQRGIQDTLNWLFEGEDKPVIED